jgi:hypothetical protein
VRFRWQLADDAVPAVALFAALGALACTVPAQNDTWWHLRSGLEIWQSQSFLVTERFSHTAFGAPLNNHWWLSQLLFYAVHALGGPILLTLVAGGCAYAAVYGSWRLARGSVDVRTTLLVFLIVATAPEWSIRPQVISLALLVLSAHLIDRDRAAWLPVVCVFWANAHALVLFGVVMAGASAADALLWSRARVRRDLLVLGLCVLSPTLSPLGWNYWPQILGTVAASQTLRLQEYRTPLELTDLPFWIMVVALGVMTVIRRRDLGALRRGERVDLVAAGVLAVAAVSAARNVAFFAVVAAPALAALLRVGTATPRERPARAAPWPAYAVLSLIVLGGAVFAVGRWQAGGVRLGWRPMSPGAVEAVRNCPGPLFNAMVDGGFLMWALDSRPVFVDSRMEAYPLDFLQRVRRAEIEGDYADLFREHDISCAIVPTGTVLHRRLAGDASMTEVFGDAGRVVFSRADRRAAASPGRTGIGG